MDNRSANSGHDPVTQAAEFFIEFRSGDATPAVRARFEKWLRSSPENVQAYLEIAAGWSELPTSDPEARIDINALLDLARNHEPDNVVQLHAIRAEIACRSRPNWLRPWALAGTLVLIALASALIFKTVQAGRTYKTGIGEQRTLILSDGSVIMLNALTSVTVRMAQHVRVVTLIRGQAYFHDTDDPDRPFIVRAREGAVRAIGTEFDVNIESDRTVVTVLQGKVSVTKSSEAISSIARRILLRNVGPDDLQKPVLVSAGQQVSVLMQDLPMPSKVDVTEVTAWMQRRLIFEDTPLEKVADQFNLYSNRRLVIADPSLRNIGVSGVYSASDPAALIGFLRSQPVLRVVERQDQFIVTRR